MSARSHFRIAGIPVHVQPVFFIIAGLFGLRYVDIGLDVVGIWMGATFISILVHELGHGIALKVFGHPSAIVLHGFGGVTVSQRRASMTKARSIIVSVAGSATALALLWWPARTLLKSDWIIEQPEPLIWLIYFLQFQNLWWSIANLLPIRPLDGGNVTAELFGMPLARRISIGVAIAAALFAFANDQGYAAFFALFLAFNNWQEIRAEQAGSDVNVFDVDAPDAGSGGGRARPRGRAAGGHLHAVPDPGPMPGGPAPLSVDPSRLTQQAWNALRQGDGATAKVMVDRLGSEAGPYLRAASALAVGSPDAFELYEAAYVAEPNGPPNLVATEVLARAGAAAAVAKRLVARSDGSGRDGAANLQTHLHYGDRYQEAAEVGAIVFEGNPASPAQTAFEVACSAAKAGDVDLAIDWLGRAADCGFRAASLVDGEPDLTAVRQDPRWSAVRERLV